MKLSVCIDAVFRGQNSHDALRATKAAGYDAYEFWGWWDKDLDMLSEVQIELGLAPVTMCTRFYSLVDPVAHRNYLTGLEQSIAAAKKLGCRSLISQCGKDTGAPRADQHANMVRCLRQAAPLLEQAGIVLLLEPLNLLDHPGYYLTSSDEAAQAVEEVGSGHVKMLFDLYHQQITEGDLLRHVQRMLPCIGHFHAAGNPGRHELDTGEINYRGLFSCIEQMGYQGYVGLEYFPERPAAEGLAEAARMLQNQ